MGLVGLILVLVGLGIMYLARQSEGVSGALFFVIGLFLFGFGIYLIFFEEGEGAARWLPFLKR